MRWNGLSRPRDNYPIRGFSWDMFTERWEEGYAHLEAYHEQHGHCRIHAEHPTPDGYPLGQWVGVQRQSAATMPSDHRARLDALGFIWGMARLDRKKS